MLETTLKILLFTLYNKTSGKTPLGDGRGRNNSNISGSQQDYPAEKFGSTQRYLGVRKYW